MKRREYKHYDAEFKREAVRLSEQDGVTAKQIAQELGVEPKRLYKWREQARARQQKTETAKQPVRDEMVRRLERENTRLKTELEILKKAVSIFAESQH